MGVRSLAWSAASASSPFGCNATQAFSNWRFGLYSVKVMARRLNLPAAKLQVGTQPALPPVLAQRELGNRLWASTSDVSRRGAASDVMSELC